MARVAPLEVILLIVLIVLVGTLLGESVHTLAVVSERTFDWLGRRYVNTRALWRERGPDFNLVGDFPRELSDAERPGMSTPEILLHEWTHSPFLWLQNVSERGRYFLMNHRRLFETDINNALIESTELELSAADLRFHQSEVIRKATREYGVDPNDLKELYPVLSARLAASEYGRARKFQALVAFCRGMWVSALLLVYSYSGILWWPATLTPRPLAYTSIMEEVVGRDGLVIVIALLVVMLLLFVLGAGRYKELYIEYLFAESFSLDRDREHFEEGGPVERTIDRIWSND